MFICCKIGNMLHFKLHAVFLLGSLPFILSPAFAQCTCNVKIPRSSRPSVDVSENPARILQLEARWMSPQYRHDRRYFPDLVHRTVNALLLDLPYPTYNPHFDKDLDFKLLHSSMQAVGFSHQLICHFHLPTKFSISCRINNHFFIKTFITYACVIASGHVALYPSILCRPRKSS